jgi:hypothetical protein
VACDGSDHGRLRSGNVSDGLRLSSGPCRQFLTLTIVLTTADGSGLGACSSMVRGVAAISDGRDARVAYFLTYL